MSGVCAACRAAEWPCCGRWASERLNAKMLSMTPASLEAMSIMDGREDATTTESRQTMRRERPMPHTCACL